MEDIVKWTKDYIGETLQYLCTKNLKEYYSEYPEELQQGCNIDGSTIAGF